MSAVANQACSLQASINWCWRKLGADTIASGVKAIAKDRILNLFLLRAMQSQQRYSKEEEASAVDVLQRDLLATQQAFHAKQVQLEGQPCVQATNWLCQIIQSFLVKHSVP